MIAAAAFCPHPPVLVPEVAQGAAPELADLRAMCRTAIARVAVPGRRIVLLGSGPATRAHSAGARGTFAGFGVHLDVGLGTSGPGPVELPLSLTVGAWLLQDAVGPDTGAIGFSIGADAPAGPDLDADVALIVLGDGSARRSTSAPGYLDERAEPFDAQVAAALGGGDGAGLAALDPTLGAELLAAGGPAWRAAGALLGGGYQAELLHDDAPYGVGYFVAVWTAAVTADA